MIKFDIVTIFPEIFESYFEESIIKRAQKKKLIKIGIHNLRQWSKGRHGQVDDRPYGGGPGMILMVEPIAKALKAIKKKKKQRIIMLTPAGKKFNQREAERLAKYDQLVLLCGRYEGFDARVDKLIDEKISIGDYVLAGGELPAMVVLEAVSRQIPGVVGHEHALDEETFSKDLDYVEYPQYTRPEILEIKRSRDQVIKKLRVPKVLLSGNHAEIKKWREKMAKKAR
jgi:tRNA (guanine37-N1)-methyltransferase